MEIKTTGIYRLFEIRRVTAIKVTAINKLFFVLFELVLVNRERIFLKLFFDNIQL